MKITGNNAESSNHVMLLNASEAGMGGKAKPPVPWSQSAEKLKVFHGDYENVVSLTQMKVDDDVSSNSTEKESSIDPIFDGHKQFALLHNLSSIDSNQQHVTAWKSNDRNATPSRSAHQFSTKTPKIVNVTSLDDTALAITSDCDDAFDISSRNATFDQLLSIAKAYLLGASYICHRTPISLRDMAQ